jgi:hypothetical protein
MEGFVGGIVHRGIEKYDQGQCETVMGSPVAEGTSDVRKVQYSEENSAE